jgi:hypothetical protein
MLCDPAHYVVPHAIAHQFMQAGLGGNHSIAAATTHTGGTE